MQLNLTSAIIQAGLDAYKLQSQDPLIAAELADIEKSQKVTEKELLAKYESKVSCPLSQTKTSPLCKLDWIVHAPSIDKGSVYLNDKIRAYLHNLKTIGEPSAEGFAFLAQFDQSNANPYNPLQPLLAPTDHNESALDHNAQGAQSSFVLKAPRSPLTDNLGHEAVVGLYGLNSLKDTDENPNAAYIFAAFECPPPLMGPNGQPITYCLGQGNSVNYVVYEAIAPNVSMAEYVRTCLGSDFLNMYMQTMLFLRLAHHRCDFTHYDLHHKNLLIRQLKDMQAFAIKYGEEYIVTNRVATLIDYGFAHIKLSDGRHQGKSGMHRFSIFPDRSWPLFDAYKLLMFCLLEAHQHNNQSVILEATKLFRFFNPSESVSEAISLQLPNYFCLPLTPELENITLDMYIDYIKRVCNCDFLISGDRLGNVQVLNPNTLMPHTDRYNDIMDVYVFGDPEIAGNPSVSNLTIPQTEYQHLMQRHLTRLENVYTEIIKEYAQLPLVNLSTLSWTDPYRTNYTVRAPDILFLTPILEQIKQNYARIARAADLSTEFITLYTVGINVASRYQDVNALTYLGEVKVLLRDQTSTLNQQLHDQIVLNHNYLESIANTPVVAQAIAQNPSLAWYFTDRRLYDAELLSNGLPKLT